MEGRDPDPERMKALVKRELFGEDAEPLRIGRFVVLRRIGAGGMGVVYTAFDEQLDRKVAIKVLGRRQDGESVDDERLLREAQAMARLSHPNAATVHEVGTVGDRLFVAMEFVPGRTLDEWVREVDPDWRVSLGIMVKAGRGLEAAHRAGLVHRDFKPTNVMVADDARVKVLDFGLARAHSAPAEIAPDISGIIAEAIDDEPSGPLELTITRTGQVLGTPAYMPPEQMAGGVADPASDQFSFCVALYEVLYGQRPLGKSLPAVALQENPDAGRSAEPEDRRGVPAHVHRSIQRGLSAAPADRWPSMTELLAELSRDPGRTRRRLLLSAAAISVVVAALYALVMLLGDPPDADARRAALRKADEIVLERARVALEADPSSAVAWLRELSSHSELWDEARAIANQARARGISRVLTDHADDVELLLPFGDSGVASASDDHTVRVWQLPSGTSRVVARHQAPVEALAVWRGDVVASASADRTGRVWRPGDREARLLAGHQGGVRGVALSPDGAAVATAAADGTVRLWDPGSGIYRIAGHHRGPARPVLFSRDQTIIVSGGSDGTIGLWPADGASGRTIAAHRAEVRTLALSPDGTKLVSGGEDGRILLWTIDGERLRELHGHNDLVRVVRFTPDGERIVSAGGDTVVRVHEVATGTARELSGNTSGIKGVAVSADGALVASAGIDRTVHVWPIDGGQPRVFRGHIGSVKTVAFTADGKALVSGSDDDTIRVWPLYPLPEPPAGPALAAWAQAVTNVAVGASR